MKYWIIINISSKGSLTSGDYLVPSYTYNDYRFWYLKSWERIWVVRLWHVCYVNLATTSPLYEIKIVLRLILLDHDWNVCILHIFGVSEILHLMRQEWRFVCHIGFGLYFILIQLLDKWSWGVLIEAYYIT